MSQQRRVRAAKVFLIVVSAIVGLAAVEALTSGVVPTAKATCMALTGCGAGDPAVNCCNSQGHAASFPNICAAQEACYYNCAFAPNWPRGCQQDPS
jgi:hypothetical protein